MAGEVGEDGLPALALELGRVRGLGVERFLHENAVGALDELDLELDRRSSVFGGRAPFGGWGALRMKRVHLAVAILR